MLCILFASTFHTADAQQTNACVAYKSLITFILVIRCNQTSSSIASSIAISCGLLLSPSLPSHIDIDTTILSSNSTMMTKVKRFTYLPIFLLAYYIIGSSTALDNEQQQLLRTTPPAATMFIDHPPNSSSSLTQRNLQTTPPAATIDDTHPITDRDLKFKNKKFFWAAGKSGKSDAGGGSGHQLPRCHGSCKSHDDCMVRYMFI